MSAPTPARSLDRSPARAMQQHAEMRALSDADLALVFEHDPRRTWQWAAYDEQWRRRSESGEPSPFDGARKLARRRRQRRESRKRRNEARWRANRPVEGALVTTHALDLCDIADRLTEVCEAARDLTPDSDHDREMMLEAAEEATLAAAAFVRAATRGTPQETIGLRGLASHLETAANRNHSWLGGSMTTIADLRDGLFERAEESHAEVSR